MNEPAIVPCKWCFIPTTNTGTRCCDPCWELFHRIGNAPALAQRMIDSLLKGTDS